MTSMNLAIITTTVALRGRDYKITGYIAPPDRDAGILGPSLDDFTSEPADLGELTEAEWSLVEDTVLQEADRAEAEYWSRLEQAHPDMFKDPD